MTLFTNEAKFGGDFEHPFSSKLRSCKSGILATGYISHTSVSNYKAPILRIVKKGGFFDLIVGMALFEGLKNIQYETLLNLHQQIRSINPKGGGVKFVWAGKFHGKIYNFNSESDVHIYVGSSNFSEAGLSKNIEGTIEVTANDTKKRVLKFLDWLKDESQSAYIDQIDDLRIVDSRRFKRNVISAKLQPNEAIKYDISTITTGSLDYFDIPLSRVDSQPRSNLNVYFGKGRLNRSTGKVIPRGWFEVEIIVEQKTARNSLYPKGDFKVITDDGYSFDCKTQSASNNYKNFRSKANLHILGKWIKSKLQKSGALLPLTPVTRETLDLYGNDKLRLYRITSGVYFMEFKPKP